MSSPIGGPGFLSLPVAYSELLFIFSGWLVNLLQVQACKCKPVRTVLCTVEYSVEAPLPAHTNPAAGSCTAHPRPQGSSSASFSPCSSHHLQLLLEFGVQFSILPTSNRRQASRVCSLFFIHVFVVYTTRSCTVGSWSVFVK